MFVLKWDSCMKSSEIEIKMADLEAAIPRKMSNTKLKLSDLNPHLMCVLCGGYYIDATTIVECLHSFCRSCIVKHLENSKYCPICEVQVHKTKPLVNIRPDKTLQDIVYKLVPGLFASEMRNRRRFYKERPHHTRPVDSESSGEVRDRRVHGGEESVTFSLVYREGPGPRRLERCCRECGPPERNERRYFRCPVGVTVQHLKKLMRAKYELSEGRYRVEIYWKDEELREDLTLLDISCVYLWKTKGTLDLTYKIFENVAKRQRMEEETPERADIDTSERLKIGVEQSATTIEEEKHQRREDGQEKGAHGDEGTKESNTCRPVAAPSEQTKENGLPGNEVKEVQLQISESGVMSVSQVEDSEIVRTVEETAAKVTNNEAMKGAPAQEEEPRPANGNSNDSASRAEKRLAGKGNKNYKTIRCSPKTWHPVIPKEKLRPTLMKNDEPRKPLKFFKMRNMPRFLGNPSTGVKPLFTGAAAKPEEKKSETGKALNKILKIDPKTLRPIEKEELKMSSTSSAPNLLTNPFIPNNNHFLFSDFHLLPPNTGSYKDKACPGPGFKAPVPNGTYPPICFPAPEHSPPSFYPFASLSKPHSPFPFPDKMDPLLRASRLSPFGNLAGFNLAGFHASLPPSISRLLNPHHHFRKMNQSVERKNKDESTKETTKRCDDSFKVRKGEEEEEMAGAAAGEEKEKEKEMKKEREKEKEKEKKEREREREKEEREREKEKEKEKEKERTQREKEEREKEEKEEKEKEKERTEEEQSERQREMNGETNESASESKGESGDREKEREKDRTDNSSINK